MLALSLQYLETQESHYLKGGVVLAATIVDGIPLLLL